MNQAKVRCSKARVAIVPIVNVEVYTDLSTAPAIQPHLRPPNNPNVNYSMDLANGGWRHYGNARGLRRLKWLFEERLGSQLGRRGAWTAVVNCAAVRNEKEVQSVVFGSLASTTAAGADFELACHGWDNSTPNNVDGPSPEDEVAYIRRCLLDLEAQRSAYHDEQQQRHGVTSSFHTHGKIDTWLTPGFRGSIFTADAARIAGVRTLLDFCDDDFPYFYKPDRVQRYISDGIDKTDFYATIPTSWHSDGKDLVCIPYSMETNDFSLVLEMKYSHQQYAQAIVDHIRQLLIEAEMCDEDNIAETGRVGQERVVCLGLHTFVAGQPARVKALGDALVELLVEFDDESIYFATAREIGNRLRMQLVSR